MGVSITAGIKRVEVSGEDDIERGAVDPEFTNYRKSTPSKCDFLILSSQRYPCRLYGFGLANGCQLVMVNLQIPVFLDKLLLAELGCLEHLEAIHRVELVQKKNTKLCD